MSQNHEILHHLKRGRTLTALDALKLFGCFRLASRIYDLTCMGHQIDRETVEVNGKRITRYRLNKGNK